MTGYRPQAAHEGVGSRPEPGTTTARAVEGNGAANDGTPDLRPKRGAISAAAVALWAVVEGGGATSPDVV